MTAWPFTPRKVAAEALPRWPLTCAECRKDYELRNKGEMKRNEWELVGRTYKGGPTFPYPLPTEEDVQRLDTLIEKTTRLYWPDNDLSDIVWDTIGPYLAGDKTMDETIRLLDNRVTLYVNELR